uniref:DUF4220 domain-containing protein n=1 Tax=Oryza punctata TaxID=4537 RepID=A0A0E0LK51_ORYPU
MAFELELGPPPNTTVDSMSVRYLLNQIGSDRATHIQILATVGAALLGFQALLGYRRRRSSNKLFLILLWAAYTVSSNVVSYTVGLVQSVAESDRYSVQQWWAVGLLLLLGSADTMSAFTRSDAEQSKGMMVQHAVQTVLVLWVLVTRANNAILLDSSSRGVNWEWTITLSVCWLYSIVKMGQRIKALRMASSSHGLVRAAKVVADYMHDTVDAWDRDCGHGGHGETAAHDLDSVDMGPYKYLVHGEEGRSTPPSEQTDYRTRVPEDNTVTIDKIWRCDGELLLSSGDGVGDKRRARARALKDTCLSFALFKLLKRRFCGLEVAEAGHKKARDFILAGLLAGHDYERAFRVVELELSFAHDFFYTKYPALFPTSAVLHIARFVSLLAFLKLFYDFTYTTSFTAKYFKHISAVGIFSDFNDFLFISMILGVEVMQQLSTGYSDWAVVHFVCDYVRRVEKKKRHGGGFRQAVIKRVAARRARTLRHWQNKLGQYSLLASFGYHSSAGNCLSWLTGRLLEPTREGRNKSKAVKLPHEVKVAVLHSLKESDGHLTVGRSLDSRLRWACDRLLPSTQLQSDTHWKTRAHTHTVLVWHIATTMCDHLDVAPAAATAGSDQNGAAATAGSDQNGADRLVATSLSGYCAYLLAFVPEMLPDHSYTAALVLDAAVQEARNHLVDVTAMPDKCKKLRDLGEINGGGREGILMDGARLGSQLMAAGYDSRQRWKLLAEVWAELVLFLAPSDNADAHAESLARGGEFMTHIWALLTHAGILDRDPEAAAPPGATAV